MKGHVQARHNPGYEVGKARSMARACKDFMIAASAGDNVSMKHYQVGYQSGHTCTKR